MKYYNSKGEVCDFQLDKIIAHGTTSTIYSLDDLTCFKKYYAYTGYNARMKKAIFQILQDLQHPYVNNIIDIYYEIKEDDPMPLENEMASGYQYYYIKEDFNSVLIRNTDYILSSFYQIEELVKLLTSLQVKVNDLKRENTVLTKEKMVLIDMDCCSLNTDLSIEELYQHNEEALVRLFQNLLIRSPEFSYLYLNRVKELVQVSDHITLDIYRKLKRYKKPLDYLRR